MVNVISGRTGRLTMARETTWGTAVTADRVVGHVQSVSNNTTQEASNTSSMGQAQSASVNAGTVTPGGSVEVATTNGRLLEYAIFGGTTSNVDTSRDCTHTFVWSNELPSETIELGYDEATDSIERYEGSFFKNASIGFGGINEPLKFKGDFVSEDLITDQTSLVSYTVPTTRPLMGYQASLSLGGSSVDYVQSWEVSVNRNSKVGHAMGSRKPAFGGSHQAEVTFKATIGTPVGSGSMTQLNRLLGAGTGITAAEPSPFAAVFSANNGVTLGSGRHAISLTLGTNSQMASISRQSQVGDFVMTDISGIGILGTTTYVDQVLAANW